MDAGETQSREGQFTCKTLVANFSEWAEQGFNDDLVEFSTLNVLVAADLGL